MKNTSTNSDGKFTTQSFDKFKQSRTTIWINPISGSKWTVNWNDKRGYGDDIKNSSLNLDLRYVETKEMKAILIDYYWLAHDWIFIRNGKLIVRCNDEYNIDLIPQEIDTEVGVFGGTRVSERGFYIINEEQLKAIFKATKIEVRISGGNEYIELKDDGLLKFQFMCKSFYSELFNDSSQNEWINSTILDVNKSKGPCFIATATLGDYNHPIVNDLRFFRDSWILKRKWGLSFTNWYYNYGAKAAKIIEKSIILRYILLFVLIKPLHILTKKLILK